MSIDAQKVLEALESSGKKGVGLITLSLQTGYSQMELRSFLKKHKQYCLPLNGATKYKLSQFTETMGSVDKMVQEIERQDVNDRISKAFGYGVVVGLFIANIGTFAELLF
jgi:hypothetical protein